MSEAGEVLYVGSHVLRVVGGRVVASEPLGDDLPAAGDPGDAARYGVHRKSRTSSVEIARPGVRAPLASWSVQGFVNSVWIGRTNRAVIEAFEPRGPRELLLGSGPRLSSLAPLSIDANVQDVDVDGGHALIGVGGMAHLMRLRDREVLRVLPHPDCSQSAWGAIERGGDRVYLTDGEELAVYRRAPGPRVGAARFAGIASRVAFVPRRDELLVATSDGLALWDPVAGGARRLGGVAGIVDAQVSPDARRAALLFQDGRIALVDLDALRAAMAPGPAAPAAGPKGKCVSGPPLYEPGESEDPGEPEDPDDDADP